MDLSDKDIEQLAALRGFLMRSFQGASFGDYKIDDAIDVLNRLLERAAND